MHTPSSKLVILDRDGVINEDSDDYVKSVDEWVPIAGSAEAMATLSQAGFTLMVATNQSGLARGYFTAQVLADMHEKMQRLVADQGGKIDGIFYCPHGPDDHCLCRKPKPGLLLQIQDQLGYDIQGSFIVGDSKRDLEAGIAMGCRPILVRTGKGEHTLAKGLDDIPGLYVCDDLLAAAQLILKVSRET